jgi:hypothetical protein
MLPYKLNHLKLICKVFQNDVCCVAHLPKHVKLWKNPINKLNYCELTWFFVTTLSWSKWFGHEFDDNEINKNNKLSQNDGMWTIKSTCTILSQSMTF